MSAKRTAKPAITLVLLICVAFMRVFESAASPTRKEACSSYVYNKNASLRNQVANRMIDNTLCPITQLSLVFMAKRIKRVAV